MVRVVGGLVYTARHFPFSSHLATLNPLKFLRLGYQTVNTYQNSESSSPSYHLLQTQNATFLADLQNLWLIAFSWLGEQYAGDELTFYVVVIPHLPFCKV